MSVGVLKMTFEEIRKNAPNGATHYRIDIISGLVVYIKNYTIKWCDELSGGEWLFVCVHEIFNIKPLH